MKRPENFQKINGAYFQTKTGKKYMFTTYGTSPELWVSNQQDFAKYVLAFVIDWKTKSYEIKRAEKGHGVNWVDTIYKGNFGKDSMKTMSSFVDWVHNRIVQFEHYYNKL